VVYPIATNGCKAWIKRKYKIDKIPAFEMWSRRRMMGIPWTAKVRNEEIRNSIKEEEILIV